MNILRRISNHLFIYPYYRRHFKKFGRKSNLLKPLKIDFPQNISIEDNVLIQEYAWLAAVPLTGATTCHLQIGEGSILGHFNHIFCTQSINIGKQVLTADKVYISDNLHNYTDINLPILMQPISQSQPVKIGDGSWIGENVCILGASIGKGCVIGANAVVLTDIPDYSVAVGVPAKVVKQYNSETKQWEKTF